MVATTIEQSNRLLKKRVPANSADMHYVVRKMRFEDGVFVPELYDLKCGKPDGNNTVPAWSFGRLWDMCWLCGLFPQHNGDSEKLMGWMVDAYVGHIVGLEK